MGSSETIPKSAAIGHGVWSWVSGFHSPAGLDRYWVDLPGRLRRYSAPLAAAWSDGLYLTAWPRLSVSFSFILFFLGLVAGSTHLCFVSVADGHLEFLTTAATFGQDFVLVVIAAAVGALSASLGLLLVLGYALGDFLVAAPQVSISSDSLFSYFFYLHMPQLVSYLLFAMLAVVPTLSSWYALADILRKIRGQSVFRTIVRAAAMAVAQGIFVYAWVLVAPMVFRVFWSWQGRSSPVTVVYFQQISVPWIPALAAGAMFLRAWLAPRAYKEKTVIARALRLLTSLRRADARIAITRRLPVWSRAALHAALVLLLSSGMIVSLVTAAIIGALLFGVFLASEVLLPKLGVWAAWCRALSRVPIGARLGAAALATFLLARFVLILPGQSVSANTNFGAFYAELTAIVVCMFVTMVLLAQLPEGAHGQVGSSSGSVRGGPAGVMRLVGPPAASIVLLLLLFAPVAYAYCADPTCCFGDNLLAALLVLALVLLAAAVLGLMVMAAAELLEFGAAVAAAEEAGAALSAAEAAASAAEAAAATAESYAAAAAAAEGVAGADAAAAAAEGAAAAATAAAEDAAAAAAAAEAAAPGSAAAEAAAEAASTAAQAAENASSAAAAAQQAAADTAASFEPTVVTNSVPTAVTDMTSQAGNIAESALEPLENTAVGPQNAPTQVIDTGPGSTGDTVIQPAPEDPSELPTQIVNPARLPPGR